MNGADALFTGMADRFIKHEFKAQVAAELTRANWQSRHGQEVVGSVLRQFEQQSADAQPASPVRDHFDEINRATDADTLEQAIAQLKELASGDGWLAKAVKPLAAASPVAFALVWEHLDRCRLDGLKQVFDKELLLSTNCLSKGEFAEGVRALLIDKDQQPRWRYATLADIDNEWINSFFV
jgi:enoyl-CoA hydratase/carnithine racemase